MNLFFEAQFLLSLLALKENQDRVPVTREDQLNMRKKPDGDGRSRRGKGKGRGRGRGKSTSKTAAKKPAAASSSIPEQAKRKALADGKGRKGGKKKKSEEGWTWEDYAEEWDQHWWDEHDESAWEGWNNSGEMWDKAAWGDGKYSLYEVGADNNAEDSKPPTESNGKRKKKQPSVDDTGHAEPKADKHTRKKAKKCEHNQPQPKAAAAPKTTARRARSASAGSSTPPAPAAAKSAPKAKASAKAAASTKKAPKAKAYPKRAPKAVPVNARAAARPEAVVIEQGRETQQTKVMEEMHGLLYDFSVKFLGAQKKDGFDLKEFKKNVRADTLNTCDSNRCTFNVYWTRPAVGITSREEKKDFAYFTIPDREDREYCTKLAIAMKSAELLVSSMHLFPSDFLFICNTC
jgi:hypothetical protein